MVTCRTGPSNKLSVATRSPSRRNARSASAAMSSSPTVHRPRPVLCTRKWIARRGSTSHRPINSRPVFQNAGSPGCPGVGAAPTSTTTKTVAASPRRFIVSPCRSTLTRASISGLSTSSATRAGSRSRSRASDGARVERSLKRERLLYRADEGAVQTGRGRRAHGEGRPRASFPGPGASARAASRSTNVTAATAAASSVAALLPASATIQRSTNTEDGAAPADFCTCVVVTAPPPLRALYWIATREPSATRPGPGGSRRQPTARRSRRRGCGSRARTASWNACRLGHARSCRTERTRPGSASVCASIAPPADRPGRANQPAIGEC